MDANNDKPSDATKDDIVVAEVARGEKDEILEESPQSRKQETLEKHRSKLKPKIAKQVAFKTTTAKFLSARIEELAKPNRRYVLITLREKASTLPPALVDNLIRIAETEFCLTPEEATRVLREEERKRKKKKKKKITRLPPKAKKLMEEITKLETVRAMPTLDRDATMCQYLMAMRLVKSILEHQCQKQRKDYREITNVILRRLSFLNGYVNAENDQAMQQLNLLADVVACWISEILVEVAETYKENLEEYCKRRQMKMMDVDDDEETESEIEYWELTEPKKLETEEEKEKVKPEEKTEESMEEDTRDDEEVRPTNQRTEENVEVEKIEQQEDKEDEVQKEENIEISEKGTEEEIENEMEVEE